MRTPSALVQLALERPVIVDVEATARIDSVHGGIRATFTQIPDAPLSKVVVEMQGGRKGLIVNSTGLCAGAHHANAQLEGHNGRRAAIRPVVRAVGCGKAKRKPVKLGIVDGDVVQVLSGVAPTDNVITEGSYGLDEGANVKIGAAGGDAGSAAGSGAKN